MGAPTASDLLLASTKVAELTAIYLGHGIVIANSACRAVALAGGLPVASISFALALQVEARSEDGRDVEAALDRAAADAFSAARAYIRERPATLALLDLPDPPPQALATIALAPIHNLGRQVAPVLARTDLRVVGAAGSLGVALAATAALIAGGAFSLGVAMAIGAAVGLTAGLHRARRARRLVCDSCSTPLTLSARRSRICPGCNGRIR
jgi:hypothetical protein